MHIDQGFIYVYKLNILYIYMYMHAYVRTYIQVVV